jgi:hypothetical protein
MVIYSDVNGEAGETCLVLGVCLRMSKARTPLCVKEPKEGFEGVVIKIQDLFVI